MRLRRVVVLKRGQTFDDLDLWPGDEVWLDGCWTLLGKVNSGGVFVSHLETFH